MYGLPLVLWLGASSPDGFTGHARSDAAPMSPQPTCVPLIVRLGPPSFNIFSRPTPPPRPPLPAPIPCGAVGQLEDVIRELNRDVDEWRERATTAEAKVGRQGASGVWRC